MLDSKFGLALLLALVVACAAPPMPSASKHFGETSLFATITPPPEQRSTAISLQPTATPNAPHPTATPRRKKTPRPTATPFRPDQLYAIEPVRVIRAFPEANATNLSIARNDTPLRAQFNYPMAPFDAVKVMNVVTQPLIIEPALPGAGYWENAFTFVYSPTVDLEIATTYTVTVKPISDTLGHSFNGYQWSFETIHPQIVRFTPKSQNVLPNATLAIRFNTAMDSASVESRFHLTRADGGADVAGTFQWKDNTVEFIPAQALERNATYRAKFDAGAMDVEKRGAISDKREWTFHIVPPFDLSGTSPRDGEQSTTAIRDDVAGFVIKFTAPVDSKGVRVAVAPELKRMRVLNYGCCDDSHALIWGDWKASTAYTVTIFADTQDLGGAKLGRDVVTHFTTAPAPSQLYVSLPDFSMMDAYRPLDIYVTHANVARINYAVYRVPRDKFLQLFGKTNSYASPAVDSYKTDQKNLVHEWSDVVPNELDVARVLRAYVRDTSGEALAPDVYLIEASSVANTLRERSLVLYSPYNLALKHTDDDAVVWATDLASGKPVPHLQLALYSRSGKRVAIGKTDADGIWRTRFELEKKDYKRRGYAADVVLYVVAESGDRTVAAVSSRWNSGISHWDFDLPAERTDRFRRAYYANLYTDRPLYRAGQTVYFKGIVRRAQADQTYSVPTAFGRTHARNDPDARALPYEPLKRVNVTIRDARGSEISRQELPLSEFGAFDGSVNLGESAPTGYYAIETDYGRATFLVAQYRRPEFQVEVTSAQPEYIHGETMRFDVASHYLFGGPVANANVTWRLFRETFSPQPALDGKWDFGSADPEEDYGGDGARAEQFREGATQTDATGKFRLELPADLSELQGHQRFTLEAEVEDLNHQVISARVVVPVYQGAFMLGLRPRDYVGQANKELTVDLIAVASRDARNDGSCCAALMVNEPIIVSIYAGQWYSTREKIGNGYEWKSVYRETLVTTDHVLTNERGRAATTFTPRRGGIYRVAATGRDAQGNRVASSTMTWVTAYDFVGWRVPNNHRIELAANQKEYAPGETAELVLLAPYADAEALLTIERDNILRVEHLKLKGNSPRITLPIPESYAPNIFVSLMVVKGRGDDNTLPQFHVAYTELKVKTVAQELKVNLTVSCGDKTEGTGDTQSASGDARPLCHPNDLATLTLDATDYLSRPVQAEFSLAMVDKAVQLLADDAADPLLRTFYFQRGLGVNTAGSLLKLEEQATQNIQTGVKGGGGGDFGELAVRRNFQDTGYWNPRLVTDVNGRAQAQTRLPDNLTTWNVTAKGITLDTRLGEARADFVSTREVLVRPVTPRFAVVGDKTHLEAVVNNNTSRPISATVSLAALGLDLPNYAPQTINVPAQNAARVGWDATVPFGERAALTFTVTADGHFDAVETTLPLQYPISIEPLADLVTVNRTYTETLAFHPATFEFPERARVNVQLTPSLAAASRASLDFLEHFGWECSEQTTSKFLPNIATYLSMKRLGIDRHALRAALQENITREIQRLYELQNNDGGWGWWRDGQSRPMLTAYALWGLVSARRAGFTVDQQVTARAEKFLTEALDTPIDKNEQARGWEVNERAFVLFVMTEIGGAPTGRVMNMYEQRDALALYGKALLTMALQTLQQPQAETLAQELRDAATTDAAGAHWTEEENDYWTMNTNTRTTAMVIMALARMAYGASPAASAFPSPPSLLPKAVRWLMSARQGDHWETTQETAWAVMALGEFMSATGELNANYNYEVKLNGETIGAGNVNASNLETTQNVRIAVTKLLERTANELAVERDSLDGTLYYSASLERYQRAEEIPAQNRGVALTREYYAVDPLTLQPTTRRINAARIGDYVQVRLMVVASNDLYYLALEDMLPAGFEAVDTTLKTTSHTARGPQLNDAGAEYSYWWYWGHSEVRDDRVALFADWLPRGTYEYTYLARASIAGEYNVLPSRAWQMYFPVTFGQSAGGKFVVTER